MEKHYVFVWAAYGDSKVYDVSNIESLIKFLNDDQNGLKAITEYVYEGEKLFELFAPEKLKAFYEKNGFEKTIRAIALQLTKIEKCDNYEYGSGFCELRKL